MSDSVTPWTVAHQTSLSFIISQSFLKLMSIELVMPSNCLILCRPLLLLPSIFPNIRVFSDVLALCIRWLKYWSFSISPSKEYSGLISFRIDWFDLLAVQGTLKSLPQHHSSKASIFWHSAFFMVQLSHPHMTTGKTIALTTWTFVGKVISLLYNTLSRFVVAFLPRSRLIETSFVCLQQEGLSQLSICRHYAQKPSSGPHFIFWSTDTKLWGLRHWLRPEGRLDGGARSSHREVQAIEHHQEGPEWPANYSQEVLNCEFGCKDALVRNGKHKNPSCLPLSSSCSARPGPPQPRHHWLTKATCSWSSSPGSDTINQTPEPLWLRGEREVRAGGESEREREEKVETQT